MQEGPAGQPPQKTTTAQEAKAVADPQAQTEREAQVMTNLPRRRPQRRSERRTSGAGGGRRPTTKRSGGTARVGRPAATRRRQPAAARAKPADAATSAARDERAPGLPELALDAAVGAAKIPLRMTAAVTGMTARLVARGLRIR